MRSLVREPALETGGCCRLCVHHVWCCAVTLFFVLFAFWPATCRGTDDVETGVTRASVKRKCALIVEKTSLPQTSGLAELATIALQGIPSVILVERTQIDRLLKECELSALVKPDGFGERLRAGNLLGADYLLILRDVRTEVGTALGLVIAETTHGLRLSSTYYPYDAANLPQLANKLRDQVEQSLSRYEGGVERIVCAPPFLSKDLDRDKEYLQTAYAAIVEKIALQCKNTAVVELREARALARERELTGDGIAVERPLPYYIVGEFRHARGSDRSSLRMILRYGESEISSRERSGLSSTEATEFIATTTRAFLSGIGPVKQSDDHGRQANEMFLLREQFEAFHALGFYREAVSIGEACLLLDQNRPQTETRKKLVVDYGWVGLERLPPGLPVNDRIDEARKRLYAHERGLHHLELIIRCPDCGVWWHARWFDFFWTRGSPTSALYRQPQVVDALGVDIRELRRRRRSLILEVVPQIYTRRSSQLHEDEKYWAAYTIYYRGLNPGFGKETFDERLEWSLTAIRVLLGEPASWSTLRGCGQYPFVYGSEETEAAMSLEKNRVRFRNYLSQIRTIPSPLSAILAEYIRLYYEVKMHKSRNPALMDELDALTAEGQQPCREYDSFSWDVKDLKKELSRRLQPVVSRVRTGQERQQDLGFLDVDYPEIKHVDKNGVSVAEDSQVALKWGDFRGVVRRGANTDVFWYDHALLEMRQRGLLALIHSQPKQHILDPVSDGSNIWFVVQEVPGHYDLHCIQEGTRELFSFRGEEALPLSSWNLVVHPVKPGVLLVSGGFGEPHRGWIAKADVAEQKTKVFFEATRIRDRVTTDDSPAESVDIGFSPVWLLPLPGSEPGSRFLLQRASRAGQLKAIVVDAVREKVLPSQVHMRRGNWTEKWRGAWFENALYWSNGSDLLTVQTPDSAHTTLASFEFSIAQVFPWRGTLLIIGRDGTWLQTDKAAKKRQILANRFTPYKRRISLSNHYGILGCDKERGFFAVKPQLRHMREFEQGTEGVAANRAP